MHAVIGRVEIKPGHEEETLAMIQERGVPMLEGMPGSAGGYWARTLDGEAIQHSFWLFDTRGERQSGGGGLQHAARHARRARDVRQRRRVRGRRLYDELERPRTDVPRVVDADEHQFVVRAGARPSLRSGSRAPSPVPPRCRRRRRAGVAAPRWRPSLLRRAAPSSTITRISAAARIPSSTQIQSAVPLLELEGSVVVGGATVIDGRVVVTCTVLVVITTVVSAGDGRLDRRGRLGVVVSAARPVTATAAARSRPAAKRIASPESLIVRGTDAHSPRPARGVSH